MKIFMLHIPSFFLIIQISQKKEKRKKKREIERMGSFLPHYNSDPNPFLKVWKIELIFGFSITTFSYHVPVDSQ
jgi:hypothetical protein